MTNSTTCSRFRRLFQILFPFSFLTFLILPITHSFWEETHDININTCVICSTISILHVSYQETMFMYVYNI